MKGMLTRLIDRRRFQVVDLGRDFSRYPAGRVREDSPFSGEVFRDEFLWPALRDHLFVELRLDSAAGYGSSFLEEVFGGLARQGRLKPADIGKRLRLATDDASLAQEIKEYVESGAVDWMAREEMI